MLRALRPIPGWRVLDAACGLGQLATELQRRGCRSFGVDTSIDAARYVRSHTRVAVVVAGLQHLPFRDGVFDGVTSGETLEHVDDDRAAIGELTRTLRNDGRCVVTVPALESLWSASDDYYEHRRRYTRRALVALFRAGGFTVERASYWGFPIVLAYDAVFLLPMNKRRARQRALPVVAAAGRSRWLVSLVAALFSVDQLFGWLPFGPGLLVVATKR